MIAKPLEAIEPADIDQLVADKVAESRTLDYKEKLPGQSDSEKKGVPRGHNIICECFRWRSRLRRCRGT